LIANVGLRIYAYLRTPWQISVHELTGRVVVYGKILPEVPNYGHGRIIYDCVQSYEKALKQCCSSSFSAA